MFLKLENFIFCLQESLLLSDMSENTNNHQGTSSEKKTKSNGDDEVTLGEVLRQQKEIEDEYEQEYLEVLGGSDDKHCTYSQVK